MTLIILCNSINYITMADFPKNYFNTKMHHFDLTSGRNRFLRNFRRSRSVGNFVLNMGICFLINRYHKSNRRLPRISKQRLKSSKQRRLREFVNDPKLSSSDRGWFQQEMNNIKRGKKKNIHLPPGKILAHLRGFEAQKGFDHKHSKLQLGSLEILQHKYDYSGLLNKTPLNYNW